MERIQKLFIIFFLLLLSTSAFARFEDLVKSIDQFFSSSKGIVVAIEGDNILIDLDKDKGSYIGKEYKIYREGVEIKHPITGAVLGKRRFYVGTLKILEVHDKYSVGKLIEKKGDINIGDVALVSIPVKTNISLKNFDKRLELLLKEDLSKSQTVSMTNEITDTVLNFLQDEKGGISLNISIGGTVVKNLYFSDISILSGKSATADILKSKPLAYELRTMAVGKLKNDDFDYIVVAEKRTVYIYKFTGKDFDYVGRINKKFDEVISVEVADLNANGIDEIFITSIDDSSYANTYVYEFKDKDFTLLKSNLPFITRSIFENGEQKLVVQRISRDGAYVGTINYLRYNNGVYERGDAIQDTSGLVIYGFGHADVDNDKIKENFQIHNDGKLIVYKNGKAIFESNDFFGETPYEFTLKEESKKTKSGNQLGEILSRGQSTEDVVDYMTRKKKLKGRVFVTSDKTIFLIKNNQMMKTLPNLQMYESASIAGYTLRDKMLRKVWESDNFDPIIADYYLVERYGKKYMYLLRVDRGGLLKGAASEIYYIEIK